MIRYFCFLFDFGCYGCNVRFHDYFYCAVCGCNEAHLRCFLNFYGLCQDLYHVIFESCSFEFGAAIPYYSDLSYYSTKSTCSFVRPLPHCFFQNLGRGTLDSLVAGIGLGYGVEMAAFTYGVL